MKDTIFLDGAPLHLHERSFPMLIHGKEGSGASFFTVSLLADLYRQGKNIIMLSGHAQARADFLKYTHARMHTVLVEDESSLNKAAHKRVIFIKREKSEYLSQLLHASSSGHSRIIVIKNIELFSDGVLSLVEQQQTVILSGDVDKSPFKYRLMSREFHSKVYFSPLEAKEITLPLLPQYAGYFVDKEKSGVLTVHH